METPGQIIAREIRNIGNDTFTIEPIPSSGVEPGCTDLGNGNQYHPFIGGSGTVDSPSFTPGEDINLGDIGMGEWDNLSSQYTGQHGAPNSMHDSEYLGGGMAEEIANTPGEYAMPYITWYCETDCECEDDESHDQDIEGWLILHRDI